MQCQDKHSIADSERKPENVSYVVGDVNESWNFSQTFDLIHVQQMAGIIRDWKRLTDQAMT